MKISDRGIALLKQFEGLELEAYQDIAGIWTIGYGHTGADVQPGMRISEREAEELLRKDLKSREDAVDRLVSVSLNQNEFDALVSFVYNVGAEAFRGSTARKRLNKGDRMGAAEALTWWNKATVNGVLREVQGLTRRRQAEKALFLTPVEAPDVKDPKNLQQNSRVTPVEDSPRRGNIAESRTVQGATVAGGAGAAASTLGRDNAEELDQIETNIESGESMTEDPSANEGSRPSANDDNNEDAIPADDADAVDDNSSDAGDGNGDEAPADAASDGSDAGGDTAGDDATGTDGAANDNGDAVAVGEDGDVVIGGEDAADSDAGEEILVDMPERPSKHEAHAVEAQLQFALLLLIVLSVLFVIYARFDDWRNYRR